MQDAHSGADMTHLAIVGPPFEGLHNLLSKHHVNEIGGGPSVEGLIVSYGASPLELQKSLRAAPNANWVQLPTAGIERYHEVIQTEANRKRVWTSAKGAYAEPVAEHALLLTLALLRDLRKRIEAQSWGKPAGRSLHGLNIVVVGAGGVAQEIVRLLKMFNTRVTVVRREAAPVLHADHTVTTPHLREVLPEADVVVLAAALTSETKGLIEATTLACMDPQAVLINIGRGGLVDTNALTDALASGQLYGAGLDVTDPEPLPDGHPLWSEARCIITPHSADTMEMIMPLYLKRIEENITALKQNQPLTGVVNVEAGY